jgi:hypothetical protein
MYDRAVPFSYFAWAVPGCSVQLLGLGLGRTVVIQFAFQFDGVRRTNQSLFNLIVKIGGGGVGDGGVAHRGLLT